MQRSVSGLVAIALLVFLAGCGGGGSDSPRDPPVDTTPNTFAFPSQTGTALSGAATSDEVVISGLGASAAVTITGGEYSINGGAFTSAAGTVSNGQRLQVRVTGSGQFSTPVSAVLTVGGVSATFTATTVAADTTPDAFTFTNLTGTALSIAAGSNEIVISGINTNAPVSITGGEYSINGGAYTAAAGTVTNGQALRVRVNSSALFSTQVSTVLTVGGVSATFSATTMAADAVPDAFQFARKSNGTRGAWVASDAVTIAGINTGSPVTIENGEYSVAGGAFTGAAGFIVAGQSLVVRARAATGYARSTRARVTVGTISASFDVTSELPNYVPDVVAFDGQEVVYLLNGANGLVFRWSLSEARYLDPYTVGSGAGNPTSMAYSSAHQRVYLGYGSGAIRYIDPNSASLAEVAFATMPMAVGNVASAGNFLVVHGSGGYSNRYVLNSSGGTTASGYTYYTSSRDTAWDATASRLYYTSEYYYPGDLYYDVIDQATGQITATGQAPYHGSYAMQSPIRLSANNRFILVGSGDIYSSPALTWAGSVGSPVTDARWFADGSMVTLTTATNVTTLQHRGATSLPMLERLTYAGQAYRVLGTDSRMAVLVINNSSVQIHTYVPNNDTDGDGVANAQDAFALDAAASVDSDRDGYPDSWNSGRSQADSTTGLTLDAFPQDSACWLSVHGNGGVCNYGATMPDFMPDKIEQHGDIVYLLSSENRRVYRWSISARAYLNPYVVGIDGGFALLAPTTMAYSVSHQRLYLGYSSGAIRYIDVNNGPAEVEFASMASGVSSLSSAGNFLIAQVGTSTYNGGYVLNSSGVVTDNGGYYYGYSAETSWDPVNSRLYYFSNLYPVDLHYDVIDQATGQVTYGGETPYHDDYDMTGVIRANANGQYVLVGGGDIFSRATREWSGSVGAPLADARWFANGSVVTLTTVNGATRLRHLGSTNLGTLEERTFAGEPLRVVGTDAAMVVLVRNSGAVQFHTYVPSNDSDGDGVANAQDAFPLDVAASVDADQDGHPDAWNAGRTQADSTTGLTLDAFPQDGECWLSAHGSGGTCNYGATIPNYVPDQVAQQGDVIYLLSGANQRVYRWSMSADAYLKPYIVGTTQDFTVLAPTNMAYSPNHQRLYLGYSNGAIRYIDVNAASAAEVDFASTGASVAGLTSAGNYVVAHSGSYYTNGTQVMNSSGVTTAQSTGYYNAGGYAWDPVTTRLYYVSCCSSSYAFYYQVINQANGQITSTGSSAYYYGYYVQPPVRVSGNGEHVVIGNGDIFAQNGLTLSGSVGQPIADARWFADNSLATLVTSGNQTMLRRLGSTNLTVLEQRTFTGSALRVVGTDTSMVVVVNNNGAVQFHTYEPSNDSDADGVTNTADAFPLDVAASVDTDQDGYPDAWNAGRTQADSTTGLALDAFPNDSACWLTGHGSGGLCNYGATIPSYVPDQVVQQGDVVYLLSGANRRVYRWSISASAYLNPYVVGINQGFTTVAPVKMAYSPDHERLYLGYSTGAIRYIDVNAGSATEVAFAGLPFGVTSLTSAGDYLVAQVGNYYSNNGRYVLDSSGVITDQGSSYYYANDYTWDPVTSRLYYISSYLYYDVIDQATGEFGASGGSSHYGSLYPQPPTRVSDDGQYILLGNGDFHARNGLGWLGSLGTTIRDARWFADGSVVTLTTTGSQTTLRRLGSNSLTVLEQRTFTGDALRVVGSDTSMAVLVVNNNNVQFHSYAPSSDSDGDGVANTADAFPLDRAASVDTDGDGYPDAWNAGRTQGDSTTGLLLDAFPTESACWQSAHGSGGVCNYAATLPEYTPDLIAQNGDIVYLLSVANKRVYRWSIATGAYLRPYVVGSNLGYSTLSPTTMAYSTGHQRLYLGYATGAIRYIDVNGSSAEVAFATMPQPVFNLGNAGNFLWVQTTTGGNVSYVLNSAGATTAQSSYYYYGSTTETTWDPATSRIYGIGSNNIRYDEINQATGLITSTHDAPYNGYSANAPIRVTSDGSSILLGSGDIYARTGATLTRTASLGKQIKDGHWKDNLLIDVDTTDRVEIREASTRAILATYQYLGQPIRIVFGTSEAYLLHTVNNTTAFLRLPFYDQDGDTIPHWWELLYAVGGAGMSDSNAADALTDLDSDGVMNQTEFLNLANPTLADTDADGLSDSAEIVTHHTSPRRADTDGDGLGDYAEVVTHHSDPLDMDSDNDGYTDFDEVLYGGNPNDPAGLPQPLTTYTQTFEGTPNLAAWTTPAGSAAPWALDSLLVHGGTASFKSGTLSQSETSSVRFRGVFVAGDLYFWTRVDSAYCCNYMRVYVDGVQRMNVSYNSTWNRYSVDLTAGVHEIEWRYENFTYSGQATDAARIDDVVFVAR
ncbi:MAG TPA: hypothetical protein VFU13_16680 [Steroidobacteraceae bacterium]|nr:hypothetical protein [Steroidobacteraceae bacterium]